METVLVISTAVVFVLSAVGYVVYTLQRRNEPVPATWILMVMVFGLANWMYWHSPNRSLAGNIANTAGLVNVVLIFFGVAVRHIRDDTWRLAFSWFQVYCLAAGVVIFIFWLFTNDSVTAYYLTQALALLAHGATIHRLWFSERSTEPLFLWIAVLIANFSAIYPAIVKQDFLAWVYLIRAIPSTSMVVYLIIRLKQKEVREKSR